MENGLRGGTRMKSRVGKDCVVGHLQWGFCGKSVKFEATAESEDVPGGGIGRPGMVGGIKISNKYVNIRGYMLAQKGV